MKDLLKKAKEIDYGITNTISRVTGNVGLNLLGTNGQIIDFESLFNTPIEKYCLGEMARRQRLRLLSINLFERNMTLYKLGDSVSGVANRVSDEVHYLDYDYTKNNNYLHDYQMTADKTTTQSKGDSNNFQNYNKEGHNTLYGITMNAYYDDNGSGTGEFGDSRKIEYYDANRNANSLLRKTKQMFIDRKINTIISRFHTDNENLEHNDTSETARSVYGLSHGRNLLTYDAERYGNSYDTNGYNNPYCRVWTHHHQYSQARSRLMRPFYKTNENTGELEGEQDSIHNWENFEDHPIDYFLGINHDGEKGGERIYIQSKEKWSWKDSGANGWKHSVLKDGLVNITPKFLGGAELNVHTRDCMFSIENLAWQGYDPYSFEQALSWEQRGPFGGRIMWFPPYGLSFNEGVSVNWNEHSFIGRGENVYTYTNTSRTGTLSFMMVVDHPSILDYATWHDPKQSGLKDTDVMRFFAGCDSMDGNGNQKGSSSILQSFAKPTPLTDEYLKPDDYIDPILVTENEKPEITPPTDSEEPSTDEEIKLYFIVYFPNNYSGFFDVDNNIVDPIAYLLCGDGAQWKCNQDDVTQSYSLPIKFDELTVDGENIGHGYEMNHEISNEELNILDLKGNYIAGTSSYGTKKYIASKDKKGNYNKKWFYRIDGLYKPVTMTEIANCFGQTINPQTRRELHNNLGLNWDINAVLKYEKFESWSKENRENIYTLAEVAYALAYVNNNPNTVSAIKKNCGELDTNRIRKLIEYFDKSSTSSYNVSSIAVEGWSNSHGTDNDNVRKERNMVLAAGRRRSVINWFRKEYGDVTVEDYNDDSNPSQIRYSVKVDDVDKQNENGVSAKKNRCAICSIQINKSQLKKPIDLNQTDNRDNVIKIQISEDNYNNLSQQEKETYIRIYYSSSTCTHSGDYDNLEFEINGDTYDGLEPNLKKCYYFGHAEKTYKNQIYKNEYDSLELESEKEKYEPYSYIHESCKNSGETHHCYLLKEQYDELNENSKNEYSVFIYKIKNGARDEILQEAEASYTKFTGWKEDGETEDGDTLYINTNETDNEKKNLHWYYDEEAKEMRAYDYKGKSKLRSKDGWKSSFHEKDEYTKDKNSLRYDQEYYFFKKLKAKDPDVFSSLVEKLQYFDPAFHSMTPEGFMGRLNFLHQCTRQGNTTTTSDKNGHTANNLAFGRPPFCILRLGDFYYQKIVIRNIDITYDPLVLDLNNEGVGVVPLIANVTLSFNFIGGGDLTGPVRRLQNAMAFNYYANGRLYDNRADRVERQGTNNWDTMDMGKVDFDNSWFYNTKMATKK